MDSQEREGKGIIKFIKQFWLKYESKIVLAVGMILVAVIAFEAGVLKGQKWQSAPLVIEKPAAVGETYQAPDNSPPAAKNQAQEEQNVPELNKIAPQTYPNQNSTNCAFVGSKKSDKYHLPTCPYAKQIKPENIVCFSSTEDAAAKGYQPDKNCIK